MVAKQRSCGALLSAPPGCAGCAPAPPPFGSAIGGTHVHRHSPSTSPREQHWATPLQSLEGSSLRSDWGKSCSWYAPKTLRCTGPLRKGLAGPMTRSQATDFWAPSKPFAPWEELPTPWLTKPSWDYAYSGAPSFVGPSGTAGADSKPRQLLPWGLHWLRLHMGPLDISQTCLGLRDPRPELEFTMRALATWPRMWSRAPDFKQPAACRLGHTSSTGRSTTGYTIFP